MTIDGVYDNLLTNSLQSYKLKKDGLWNAKKKKILVCAIVHTLDVLDTEFAVNVFITIVPKAISQHAIFPQRRKKHTIALSSIS